MSRGATPTVAGLDGCRGGWVIVTLGPESATVERIEDLSIVVRSIADGELALVGVDMPIGLVNAGRRACDVEARRLLGPRRSSVFPAPIRPIVDETDYPTALARSRAIHGVGLSKQAFNLLPAIRQVDRLARELVESTGALPLREIHPELAFAALAGAPLEHPKRSPEGLERRRTLIADSLPELGPDPLTHRPANTGADDVLDAAAVAWSARRIARGHGRSVGSDDTDDVGLPMRVWW